MPGRSWENPLLNRGYRDILCELSAQRVEYLVVGAFALAAHGLPRATGDIDVWVRASADNAPRVAAALAAFGAPVDGISVSDFAAPGSVVQLGVAPCRIDILTQIDGLTFDEAWPCRMEVVIGDLTVPVLSRDHLIRNKQASGRPKDRADVQALRGTGQSVQGPRS
jgi:hypothetical protein